MFHYTVQTNKSVEETIRELEGVLKEEKFGVLWDLDIKETLETKGLDFNQNFRVLEVCNPATAKEVLTQDPMIGYFLPCKIVVYEERDQTKIGMPRPTVLFELTGNVALKGFAEDIEDRLTSCMDQVAES